MDNESFTSGDIGEKLKALRENRQLSMRQLAARADLSASLISKIEANKVSPTVMTLDKLLHAMNVDLHTFFFDTSIEDPANRIVFRKSEMAVSEDKEHKWYYAFPNHPDIKGELTYEEYFPHTKKTEKEKHNGDVCGLVIEGELTLDVTGRGIFKVNAGDAFYVRKGQQHIARNDGDEILKLVATVIK